MSLNTNPINLALWKPNNLILGADRTLFILLAILTVVIIFVIRSWVSYIFGPILFYSILRLLQKLAQKDPLYLKIIWRHLQQQKYYPAGGFYPGAPTVIQYYFDAKIGVKTTGLNSFWSIFYFIFPNSDKKPKQESENK